MCIWGEELAGQMAQVQRYHQMEILKESEFSNLASLSFQMLVFPVSYINFQFVCLHKFNLQLLVFLKPFLWTKHLLSRTVTPGTIGLSPETLFQIEIDSSVHTQALGNHSVTCPPLC